MAGVDGYVQVPPDSSGKKIDTDEITTTSGTVERQRITIPDPVEVDGDALVSILIELRVANLLWAQALGIVNADLSDDVSAAFSLARLTSEDQLLVGGANVTAKQLSAGSFTVDCGARPLQYITNSGAFTITAPTRDGSCMLLVTNASTAGAITFSGFSVGSNVGDTYATTSGYYFTISIWRINGVSGYRIAAHQ